MYTCQRIQIALRSSFGNLRAAAQICLPTTQYTPRFLPFAIALFPAVHAKLSAVVDAGLRPQHAAYRRERLVVQLHRVPIHAVLDAHSFFAPFQIATSLPYETI